MKRKLLSLATALCMVLTLPPTAAFADENAETPVCSCEEACRAENLNTECPVCGAEGAEVEKCSKYTPSAAKAQAETEKAKESVSEAEQTEADEIPEATGSGENGQETSETEEAAPENAETEAAVSETTDAETAEPEEADPEVSACSCEGPCSAQAMNAECPVCGAEGAAAENCREYIAPVSEEETEEEIRLEAPAEGEDYSYLNYTIEDNGTITITDLNDSSVTEVIIPAQIDGVDVTAIGDSAFASCTNLTSITIPDSVKCIGSYAFQNCKNLTSINIPDGVEIINIGTFKSCSSLAGVAIPDSVKYIGSYAFQNCKSLANINIPNGVETIQNSAFESCSSLAGVTIPNSVTIIGVGVFRNCTSLAGITIPNSVTDIPYEMFKNCTGLAGITIPNSVTNIGGNAFKGCDGLQYVYYIGTEEQWNTITGSGKSKLDGKVIYLVPGITSTLPNNPVYDGNSKEATVTSSDSDYGAIAVKYYDDNGRMYTAGPVDAGTYTVKIDIEASSKYPAVSDYEVGRFTILQAENCFTTDLSIEGWTYGDTPKAPTAAAKFGGLTFSYSTEENGTYTTDQPTNAGTYWVKAAVGETKNYTGLEAKTQFTVLPKLYTVTYAAGSNGTGTVAAGSKTHDVAFTLSSETFTRAGYEQTGWTDADGGEKVYDLGGTYTANEGITLYPVWRDITIPTGEISIDSYSWTKSPDDITFGLFFQDAQSVTITAGDNSGEEVTIGFLLSDKALTPEELAAAAFDTYDSGFTIAPDCACVVYARLTDNSGNKAYISSDGIVLDATAPVISGIEDDKTYCSVQTFTLTETYPDKVTVNGKEVTPDGSNQYTLNPAEGVQTIVAADKAGNKAEMTVTINDGHTFEWQSENGKYWKKCQLCGNETAKKEIPAITINGADKVCATQEYKFSFTLPEGTADPIYGYDFTTKGDMGFAAEIENGEPCGVVSAEWYDLNQSSFEVYAGATTEDGFKFYVSKTVSLQGEHIDAEPKDHICDICGEAVSRHTGGEATCISRAVCDYCGEEYGEPDTANHDLDHHEGKEPACAEIGWDAYDTCKREGCNYTTYQEISALGHDLELVPAKAATVSETGNIEYWQCQECGDIFSDEDGKNKIEPEDTVTAKLPPEIIEGTGQSVTAGEKKALSFKSNAAFSDFICVELDGKTLDEKYYSAEEGSTVVTLDADYVSTLSTGQHTIGIVSESGTASTIFTVNAKADSTNPSPTGTGNINVPNTGDNSPVVLWIALFLAGGCLLNVTVIYGKKKKYNR